MSRLASLMTALVLALAGIGGVAAQEVTLRLHQFLPMQSTMPAKGIVPWVRAIEEQSGGRIKFELYPSMQLGGAPADLFDQARDGVADVVWTVLGYTPGRFPKSEVFELPFLMTAAEASSVAFQHYVEAHALDEFASVKLIAVHTHGPGLFHTAAPVSRLEDLRGMKIRGGSRVINDMLARLGAEPIGMPAPSVPEALSTGVISGATLPWEVTTSLRVPELVHNHTGFSGDHGLYTQTFALVMNRAAYDGLPDDLKAVIDANSGVEVARHFGRVAAEGDKVGFTAAAELGNTIITLDPEETARWQAAAQPTIEKWFADMQALGVDGEELFAAARALVETHSGM